MATTKKCKVEVRKDHLSKLASGSPERALSELIWNSIDADSTKISVVLREGEFGVEEITVEDNGVGMDYQEAEMLFVSLGGSWKSSTQRTDKGRYLHGKDGEGRFRAFALGRVVDWEIVYKPKKADVFSKYTIEGISDSIDEFGLSQEANVKTRTTGVTVKISELNSKATSFNKDRIFKSLTPIFAPYLSNYKDIELKIDGSLMKPDDIIQNKEQILLDSVLFEGEEYEAHLELIEWKGLKERELWLCDSKGFPLDIYSKQIRSIGEFGFSGYLKSELFPRLQKENLLSLGELNKDLSSICDQAVRSIKDYFAKRTLEKAKDQLDQWKEEKVYPYQSEPQSPIEKAERQVFDIVALNVNDSLPSLEKLDSKSKAFQFRMLRQAIEKSPEELQSIINEVLHLPQGKQEQLAELLQEASLSAIISASKMVTDRLKFISGLEHLLFDTEAKKNLKERSQLHRILADNTWVFGHAFSLSVDDRSLTEVLKKHASLSNIEAIIDDPVKRIDGKVGIVDLMLSRSVPRNRPDDLEHLVVELKAPKVVIGSEEINQIESYAFAVAKDERFKSLNTRWNFWIISNDYDDYAEMKLNQDNFEDGVIYKAKKQQDITIWIKTWSQLIAENKHRLEFIKDKLEYNVSKEDALMHLKNTYAEYTEGVVTEKASQEKLPVSPEETMPVSP